MTLDSDTDREQAAGAGETPTLPPGTLVDESHDSDSMGALLAAVAAAPSVRIDRRASVGIEPGTLVDDTYRVLRRLGGGGMGVVYLAEHVELHRQVALKLHLGELDSTELLRLRREARVMARLSHTNVLAVHGVGTHDGRMFIAMEYAEGGTLKTWLEAGPRPWREIVAMLAQAGRGLAAAHRVGVVHRDFKPDNVLIGADERPRVADFGLARRWDDEPATEASSPALVPIDDAHRFTVTGAVVGTPAYMSPEQFDGIEVGPGSDQFSFCVVLYEALLGRRPFSGRTTMELAAAVHMGKLQPVPPGAHVPAGLLSILARGLRPVPGDRYPSMEALVDVLERAVGARARRTRWAVGTATLGAALLVGNQVAVMAAPVPCENAEQGLESAWDEARREAVVSAWPAAVLSEQDASLAAIDAWSSDWRARRREACEATRVHEDQSELAFTLRMACLDRMAARLDALTGELAMAGSGQPTMELVRSSLPELSECEDVDALDRLVNRFSSESMRSTAERDQAWIEAEALLVRASTRSRLGRPDVAAMAEHVVELAQRHELALVEVNALILLADQRMRAGELGEANDLSERALRLALGLGMDAAAELVLGRVEVALEAGRPDEAAVHLSYFDALLDRVRVAELAAQYGRRASVVRGRLALARGDAEAAVQGLERVVDDAAFEPTYRLAALRTLGRAYGELGRHAQALAVWGRLSVLVEAEQGPDSLELLAALNNVATTHLDLGDSEQALLSLARAEEIAVRTVGAEHPYMAAILTNRGTAERELGRTSEARALQEQALALRTRIYGEAHAALASNLDELGELARLRGDHTAALSYLARARRLREEDLGAEHPSITATLLLEARVKLDMGDPPGAEAALDRALGILARDGADPIDRAEVELLLAEATHGRDPSAARRWAVAAEEHAGGAGAAGEAVRGKADAWLAAHPAAEAAVDRPR
jgi:tetratricopeptide (TPR) repeat protein/predicted Ser/Thr protein kinase